MNRSVKLGFPGSPESEGRTRTISRRRRAVRCSSVLNRQNNWSSGRFSVDRDDALNRNHKLWDRANHGEHGASRGKTITIAIPVFPVLPVVEHVYQCCLVRFGDAGLQLGA
jgi:hypothetical protein